MNNRTVKVYDTITGKMVDVEVSQEVYDEYKRSIWREEKNDASFYEHEIQFSQLIGGDDDAFENFHEFIADGDPTFAKVMTDLVKKEIYTALAQLDKKDQELIEMLFFVGMTEREAAEYLGISQKNINKKKHRILAMMYNLINL